MTAASSDERLYLRRYLAPLAEILERSDVTDIYVNRPEEVWVETAGGAVEHHKFPGLTRALIDRLSRQIAAVAHQGISRESPLLSASLPTGQRVQIIAPPATRGEPALAIRNHVTSRLRLDDYGRNGAFTKVESQAEPRSGSSLQERLRQHLDGGRVQGMLQEAVLGRCNILVSGGTSTGKTTFLNALIAEIPDSERLIAIEDTPELALHQPNSVGLVAARSTLGESRVTMEDLLNAALRMRPDRIILGELRGPEAFTFLRAVNTGHPGSMTTVHADSPERAIEQIALLVLQGGARLRRDDIIHYVRSTIDVYVQLGRIGGRRLVEDIQLRRP